jgi:ABC-type antimicrobial peptide transport system permease subunit
VARRAREIGLRLALGAPPSRVLALVLGDAARAIGLGALLGLAAAGAAGRVLASMLFDTSAYDPVTYAGVVAVLGGMALLATARPLRRAVRTDPAAVLRAE